MRRCEQDKEHAASAQGAYIDVRDQAETQVRRRIAKYIRVCLKIDAFRDDVIHTNVITAVSVFKPFVKDNILCGKPKQ